MKVATLINTSSKPDFWTLQIIGWSGYVLLMLFEDVLIGGWQYLSEWILALVCIALAGIVITVIMRYIYRILWPYSAMVVAASVIVCCLIFAIFWVILKNHMLFLVFPEMSAINNDFRGYLTGFAMSWFMLMTWSALYFAVKLFYRFVRERNKVLKVQELHHHAQIKMLRYQLNPHFLFNTLNAISTLVLTQRNETANNMLERLSDFLRFSLDHDPDKKISLKAELDITTSYLEIEKARFADRLNMKITVSPQAEKALVPSLILQPIVENSIKYAVALTKEGGCICIQAFELDNKLIIEIEDSGTKSKVENGKLIDGEGIGLNNIRNRLSIMYGSDHYFTLSQTKKKGLRVVIIIPYERSIT